MAFVKVLKNKAYFKRFQVKYRRRREGKTDYKQRRGLTANDKNKYEARKYRLVVRLSNHYCLCQVVYPTLTGDRVLCQASSRELKRYGLTVGLKNWAASYCTGLLLARRVLAQLGIADKYQGITEASGDIPFQEVEDEKTGRSREYMVFDEVQEDRRPFKCFLDVGLRPATTGHRVFAAMKGASDGGIDVPYSEKRFPKYNRQADADAGEEPYDPDAVRERIFGAHVADYMAALKEDGEEQFNKDFHAYVKAGIEPTREAFEALYSKVHEAIRADPSPAAKTAFVVDDATKAKYRNQTKKTYEQRKADAMQKRTELVQRLQAADDEDEDDDDDDEEDDE